MIGTVKNAPPSSSSSSLQEDNTINCICTLDEDDGFTIQCETCLTWQHAACVGISQSSIPLEYICSKCSQKKTKRRGRQPRHAFPSTITELNSGSVSTKNPILSNQSQQQQQPTHPAFTYTNKVSESVSKIVKYYASLFLLLKYRYLDPKHRSSFFNLESSNYVIVKKGDLKMHENNLYARDLNIRGQRRLTQFLHSMHTRNCIQYGGIITDIKGDYFTVPELASLFENDINKSLSIILHPVWPIGIYCSGGMAAGTVNASNNQARGLTPRRSCRPNCELKTVFVLSEDEESVAIYFALFAISTIYAGDEILLSFNSFLNLGDWEGNDKESGEEPSFITCECSCGNPDLCLYTGTPAPSDDATFHANKSYMIKEKTGALLFSEIDGTKRARIRFSEKFRHLSVCESSQLLMKKKILKEYVKKESGGKAECVYDRLSETEIENLRINGKESPVKRFSFTEFREKKKKELSSSSSSSNG